jgi:hypothetical protein
MDFRASATVSPSGLELGALGGAVEDILDGGFWLEDEESAGVATSGSGSRLLQPAKRAKTVTSARSRARMRFFIRNSP